MNLLRENQFEASRLLIPEDIQILYVTIPWDIQKRYVCWPRELPGWLFPFFGYSASMETVMDQSVEKWLREHDCRADWERFWPYPAYGEYHRLEYAEVLFVKAMEKLAAKQVHCYVLGYEDFVPQVLAPFLRRIKALTFIIAENIPGKLTEYLENLAWEEGLAASLQHLEDKTGYRRLRLECHEETVVLDFTGEEKAAPVNASKSIAWIDMDSKEMKKHRILMNSRETVYFSMKEEWGRLDTAGKNGYNTIVN